jgi:hypothetical protein
MLGAPMTREQLRQEIYLAPQAQAALGASALSMHNWRKNGTLVPLLTSRRCNVYWRADVEALRAAIAARIPPLGRPPKSRVVAT